MALQLENPQQIVLEWQGKIYDYAFRQLRNEADAADITQESLIALIQERDRIRDPAKTRAWIYRVTLNKIVNFRRSKEREARRIQKLSPAEDSAATVDLVTKSGAIEKVRQAVSELPWELQEVLVLRYFHELTQQEIADALQISRAMVRRRLDSALERLRSAIEQPQEMLSLQFIEASLIGASLYSMPGQLSKPIFALAVTKATALGVIAVKKAVAFGVLSLALVAGTAVVVDHRAESHYQAQEKVMSDHLAASQTKIQSLSQQFDELKADMLEKARQAEQEHKQFQQLKADNQKLKAQLAKLQSNANSQLATPEVSESGSSETRLAQKEKKKNPGEAFSFGLGGKSAVFDKADWTSMTSSIQGLHSLMPELTKALLSGKPANPKTMAEIQQLNLPLAKFAIELAGDLEEKNPNNSYTHPAVMANFINGVLAGSNEPLTEAQLEAINNLGQKWELEKQALASRYTDATLALEKVYDEAASKQKFVNSVKAQLSANQIALLFYPETTGRVGVDLLSPALIYQSRWPIRDSNPEQLQQTCVIRLLSLSGMSTDDIDPKNFEWLSNLWMKAYPAALIPQKPTSPAVLFPHFDSLQTAVKAQIQAIKDLIRSNDLNEEQRAALRATAVVLVPQVISSK